MLLCALLPTGRAACQSGGAYPLGRPTAPDATAASLTVVINAKAGEEQAGLGSVRWNAGVIDIARANQVAHTFTLKNTTAKPITVSHLRGSCGCETLLLKKNGAEASTATLAPGETAEFRVTVALHPGQSGEMHKYAWAYGPNATAPALASLEMAMTVRPAIVYSPDVLDFGSVMVGDTKSVTVTATADSSVLAGKPLPTPVGTTGSIAVVPAGPETAAQQDGKAARTRQFRVTLTAPAEAGPVSGAMSMPSSAPPALAQVSIPLTGTISGQLTAQPRAVFFGSVPAGQGMTREVVLSEAASQHGKPLSATSGSPWLTALVQTTAGANPVLEVTLKPNAPVGVVQTQIIVVSASGERLTVPVVGEVLGHS